MKASIAALAALLLGLVSRTTSAFLVRPSPHSTAWVSAATSNPPGGQRKYADATTSSRSQLDMVGGLFRRSRNRIVRTLEREKVREDKKAKEKDPQFRVMLYNTEYQPEITAKLVARTIPVINRAVAFELATRAREVGKVLLIVAPKKQAEVYCLGLRRRGLPVTIEPHDVER